MEHYSVLMSVYYKEKPEYLKAAIESMLNQILPANDFVIICDGPLTLELDEVINWFYEKYPELFQIYRLEKNQGLGNALNTGLKLCKNELVARMDSDDISLPERCQLQLDRFRQNPELALCSGNIAEFEDDPEVIRSIRVLPTTHKEIHDFAKRRNPMNHMAVMYKKSKVEAAGNYIDISLAEDYYLWVRMLSLGCEAANINHILVKARIGNGMYKRRGGISYVKSICDLEKRIMYLGFISKKEFIQNCVIRVIAGLMPVGFRKILYRQKLRKC